MSSARDHARAAVEAMYADDHASRALGIEIVDVAVGTATVTMTVGPTMVNGHDVCHGGLIFVLADTAMAFASNSHNVVALATSAEIDFVNPAHIGAVLTATATETVKRGKSAIHDVHVTADDGTTVALFRGRTLQTGGPITS